MPSLFESQWELGASLPLEISPTSVGDSIYRSKVTKGPVLQGSEHLQLLLRSMGVGALGILQDQALNKQWIGNLPIN